MTPREDSVGTIGDANDGAVIWRDRDRFDRQEQERFGKAREDRSESEGSSQFAATSAVLRSSITAVADIAILLAVVPLLIFSGPTTSDTAYGAALPIVILSAAPFIAWSMTRAVSNSLWSTITCLVRLGLAVTILYSPEIPWLSGSFLEIVLALLWSMRLQEIVIDAGDQKLSLRSRAAAFALPAIALASFLKFYNSVQPLLVPSAIALYATAVVIMIGREKLPNKRHATTGTTANHLLPRLNWAVETLPALAIYEIVLSCLAGMMCVVPVVLLLTDQSAILPALRNDVSYLLSGWLAGSVLAMVFLARKNSISVLKLEQLHLLLTVLLGALSLCKYPSIANPLLFLTTATASAIAIKVAERPSGKILEQFKPTWQPAMIMTILVVISFLSYLDLSPKVCALQPIHVDRTLAAICFIPSAIAVFVWSGSRAIILKLVAYLVPAKNPMKQSFQLYMTRNLEITTAILVGWRLNATIVILTKDSTMASNLAKGALQAGNIHALGLSEWRLASELIVERLAQNERFLIYDLSESAIEDISPLPGQFTVGLIQRLEDQKAIVISDMVPRSQPSMSVSVR